MALAYQRHADPQEEINMTKEAQKQLKETAVDTGKRLPTDWWMWFILIEAIASQVLGYWSMIAPMLGALAPYIQGGLAILRSVVLGVKTYRAKNIKVGGTG